MQVDQYLQNSRSAEETCVPAAAAELAPVLGWSVSDTEEALTGDRGFVYLLKNVEPAVRDAALALEIPGIGADPVADRIYPAGSVGGNILGFVGDDGAALAGTELSFDDTLRGTDGKTQYERGADRKSTRLNSSHVAISYAVFCLKKKTAQDDGERR